MNQTRQAYQTSYSIYRAAQKVLLAPGAIETVNRAVTSMRTLSGNWDIPHFVPYPSHFYARRISGVMKLAGPYNSGRKFLRSI
jgi:hypothetical protein